MFAPLFVIYTIKKYKIGFSHVIEIQIFFLKYLTHNLAELYIKQKLLKNAIWDRNFKILAKRKVF